VGENRSNEKMKRKKRETVGVSHLIYNHYFIIYLPKLVLIEKETRDTTQKNLTGEMYFEDTQDDKKKRVCTRFVPPSPKTIFFELRLTLISL